jgi:RND superfamily putative drug exporter
MARLARFVAGRRTKWIVIGIWILLFVGFMPLGSKLSDKTTDTTESFLPKQAESTKVVNLLTHQFEGGETQSGLIVYERKGGLTAADKARIASDAQGVRHVLGKNLKTVALPFGPGGQPIHGLTSPQGDVAFTALSVPNDQDKAADWGKDVRKVLDRSNASGVNTYLTGDLGFNTDAQEVFGSLDAKLLIATVLLVLVLLGFIYRSPLIAITPLIVVFFAYTVANGFIYLYADAGAQVSTNATSILIVLMFGVGTDYCLLLVSRYREELRVFEDKHDAMAEALTRTAPAIIASGLTVALSMLVLLVAETGSIHALGPVAAIGVACAFMAGITLLPALLTWAGRPGFWPRRRFIAYDPEHAQTARPGLWGRVGEKVLHRPGFALAGTVAVFAIFAIGLTSYTENFSTTGFFKKQQESVDGFKVIQRALPAGTLSPMTVLVQRDDGGKVNDPELKAVAAKLKTVDNVADVAPSQQRSKGDRIGNLSVVLKSDPNSQKALDTVPRMRDALKDTAPGVTALVGGGTGIYYDYDHATNRDTRWIVPLGLLVVTLILGILLQAVVAPLVLIATVILSFFGTFGLAVFVIRHIVGDAGVDSSMIAYTFIFLVSLGVDYTIFLMSRVREEARVHGTREGTLRALNATGPVITSAGVILAGTFSVLMTLPVTFTFNLGFAVAVGILLDTFVVRTIMVPAAIELIGDRIWWPSTAQGGGGALRERSSGAHPQVHQPLPAAE